MKSFPILVNICAESVTLKEIDSILAGMNLKFSWHNLNKFCNGIEGKTHHYQYHPTYHIDAGVNVCQFLDEKLP